MGPTICIIHRIILLMNFAEVECISLRDREDRELFPRYEFNRQGNAGIAG
jgi:hypothetical protein